MTYFIETYGCQMNVHDSERIAGLLEASGYESVARADEADVVVINTCSVREKAEDKLYARLDDLKGRHRLTGRAPVVAVTGCVAQQEGDVLLKRSSLIDVVVGTQRLQQLPLLLHAHTVAGRKAFVDTSTPYDEPSFPLGITKHADRVRAYVTIIEGCNEFCAFCVVPYTRGHERMRKKSEILADVRSAVAAGRQEVQLLGQIVNHFQAPDDPHCDFPALLEAVQQVPGVTRIRFASPHPRHASERLLEAIRDLPAVCKHLHLPVQSGATSVLQRMRRRYTREMYLDLVAQARETVPGIQLSTDMIVGFPEESDGEFAETLSLTQAVGFHSMFSFKYSPRPNTLASKRMHDDVPEPVKTERIMELQALQRDIQFSLHQRMLNEDVKVLVDSHSRRRDSEVSGRTSGNTVVNLPGPAEWVGREVVVRIKRAGPHSVWGEPAAHPSEAIA